MNTYRRYGMVVGPPRTLHCSIEYISWYNDKQRQQQKLPTRKPHKKTYPICKKAVAVNEASNIYLDEEMLLLVHTLASRSLTLSILLSSLSSGEFFVLPSVHLDDCHITDSLWLHLRAQHTHICSHFLIFILSYSWETDCRKWMKFFSSSSVPRNSFYFLFVVVYLP